MEQGDYTHLMTKRIRRMLLVCNNYDSFVLEEDGRIEVQIAEEYQQLNLSNPPSIVRAATMAEALKMIQEGEHFDLIITMYNLGHSDVFEFGHDVKSLLPDVPIVLLTSFSKEVYQRILQQSADSIDYIFCWNNSPDLIIAIIKLLEDKLNAAHDILTEGVQAILLVEDSIRYYSTYLPLLYTLVLKQNSAAIRDALNEKQQVLRKRARPKVLMATCYDEAVELYNRYKNNILGVISDVGFVIHKGDDPYTEKLDAGIDLCHLIRTDNPTMPFILQSSQESMRAVAKQLHVGFVVKTSKTLTHELSEYIEREFGFGDFVVTDPKTHQEIARASDLEGFERILATIPSKLFRTLSDNNYLSKWLFARGMFDVAHVVRPFLIKDDNDIENIRAINIRTIHEFRIKQALGVVARFNPETYNDTIWFARLGNGSLGGKARGLAFLNHILHQYDLYDQWSDVRVLVPRTLVITTEYFDQFIRQNGLTYVINADLSDEEILSEFVSSTLPQELTDALRKFIQVVHKPLAVRSSSKLEDSYYQPFAGVYSTYLIPHTDNEDQQLRLLSKAIKSVYASVYYASSRGYITATANVLSEEKMAIVLQEICGSEDGEYYYPTLSGVARSVNYYPVGHEKTEDGIIKLAFGLGKAVVDGEEVLRFSPAYPQHALQLSTPELTMQETQKNFFVLNLQPEKFKTSTDDGINLERLRIGENDVRGLRHVVSTYDIENLRMVDSPAPKGPKYITFAQMLKFKTFPVADIGKRLLKIAKDEMKCDVELEFAADIDTENGIALFNVLQIRPISSDALSAEVDWSAIDEEHPLITSESALGTGYINDVKDIIYLRPEAFDALHTNEMAAEVSQLNKRFQAEGKNYVLIGYGRWGSCISSLGVPVKWSDISEAKAIVECTLPFFRIDPSQGTHFFQNLTSFNVGYVHVDAIAHTEDCFDVAQLEALPAEYESQYIRWIHSQQPLKIIIDGKNSKALISLPSTSLDSSK